MRLHRLHRGRYGSPRIHAALREEGIVTSPGRVARLMRKYGLRALAGRKFKPCTTDSRHDLTIAPNLLEQGFGATAPNQIWLADITSTPTGEGWLGFGKCPQHFRRLRYLAAVRDMATLP